MTALVTLILYGVRNNDGKYLQSQGDTADDSRWVDDPRDGKLYVHIGQARGRITYCANNNSMNYPVPELVEFRVVEMRVLDEAERVQSAKQRKDAENARRHEAKAKWELEAAERQLNAAKATIARLTKGE